MFGKDKDIHPEVKNIKSGMKKVLSEMMDEKILETNKKIDSVKQEIETVKKGFSSVSDVSKENTKNISKLQNQRESLEELQKKAEKDLDNIKKHAEKIEDVEKKIKELKIDEISNNIALMKKRMKWIENTIARIDMKAIYNHIKKLENDIESLKMSQPTVIE